MTGREIIIHNTQSVCCAQVIIQDFNIENEIHIYFECDNLDKYVSELLDKGIEFDEMPNDKSWLWREAHLKDIDKNHLILYYAGENRLNPPWKLK